MSGLQERRPKGVGWASDDFSNADEVQNGGDKGEILGVIIYTVISMNFRTIILGILRVDFDSFWIIFWIRRGCGLDIQNYPEEL